MRWPARNADHLTAISQPYIPPWSDTGVASLHVSMDAGGRWGGSKPGICLARFLRSGKKIEKEKAKQH
jgi:hypothetical protein